MTVGVSVYANVPADSASSRLQSTSSLVHVVSQSRAQEVDDLMNHQVHASQPLGFGEGGRSPSPLPGPGVESPRAREDDGLCQSYVPPCA